jgi:hypothetical protein
MTWSLIRYVGHSGSGTSSAIDTTGADLIVVSTSGAVSNPGVTDSAGNTYTHIIGAGHQGYNDLYYCAAPTTSGSHTFTCTYDCAVLVYSGADASPLDQYAAYTSYNGAIATVQPGSITPSVDGCLIVTGLDENSGTGATIVGINSGFTIEQTVNHGGVADLIQTTAAPVNPTWTISSTANIQATIASFKPASGGGGGGSSSLFRQPLLNGLGSGGPFFSNPLGRSMLGWRKPRLVLA